MSIDLEQIEAINNKCMNTANAIGIFVQITVSIIPLINVVKSLIHLHLSSFRVDTTTGQGNNVDYL